MDLRQIQAAILARGIAVKALDQVVARCQTRFGESAHVTPHDLDQFLDDLDVWTKVGLGKEEFLVLPGSERMTLARSFEPPVPIHPRRPVPDFRATPEQQTELDQVPTMAERMTRYREMRDQAAQTPAPRPDGA